MIPESWKAKLEEYAAKFDPAKDQRIHGGKGMVPILCQDCEDEGFVYFNRIIDGTADWFIARCVCGSRTIPPRPRSCEGRKIGTIPTWAELGIIPHETYPLRLQPLAASTGLLPFPCFEPLRGEVKYRSPIYDHVDPLEREGNQEKYDKKWGPA